MDNQKISTLSVGEEFALKTQREQKRESLTRVMPVIVLAVLVAFFSIACPDSFLTLYNLKTILNQLSITLIIALGITFVILTGSVDLSVDGVVGLAGSLVSVLVMNSNTPPIWVFLACCSASLRASRAAWCRDSSTCA